MYLYIILAPQEVYFCKNVLANISFYFNFFTLILTAVDPQNPQNIKSNFFYNSTYFVCVFY